MRARKQGNKLRTKRVSAGHRFGNVGFKVSRPKGMRQNPGGGESGLNHPPKRSTMIYHNPVKGGGYHRVVSRGGPGRGYGNPKGSRKKGRKVSMGLGKKG